MARDQATRLTNFHSSLRRHIYTVDYTAYVRLLQAQFSEILQFVPPKGVLGKKCKAVAHLGRNDTFFYTHPYGAAALTPLCHPFQTPGTVGATIGHPLHSLPGNASKIFDF